jgi:iduronate 2-sulfatase
MLWSPRRSLLLASVPLAVIVGCGGGASLVPTPSPTPASTPARKPNVLLIVADDLNLALGTYGHPQALTPRIDGLAKRGVRFSRAYAAYPLCNPSRSSFLTGLFPETLGVLDGTTHFRAHRPEVVSLPQLFRRNGYHAIGLSKVFHDGAGMNDAGEWDESRSFSTTARGLQGTSGDLSRNGFAWRWLAADGDDLDQIDGQAARAAVDFLAHRPSQPFFLAVGLSKPHEPFAAPRRYFDLYPPQQVTVPRVPTDDRRDIPAAALPPPYAFTEDESRQLRRAYFACVSFIDEQVGVILTALETQGIADQTVVVFLGDNGHHLGEHFHWGKATLFEPSLGVPLLFAGPGVTAQGRACPRTVDLTSLYATLASLADLPLAQSVDSPTLLPLLQNPDAAWTPAYSLCAPVTAMGRSVRNERWRYTEWGGAGGLELYDEDSDPNEWTNRAGDPALATTLTEMRTLLHQRWPAATGATSDLPD